MRDTNTGGDRGTRITRQAAADLLRVHPNTVARLEVAGHLARLPRRVGTKAVEYDTAAVRRLAEHGIPADVPATATA